MNGSIQAWLAPALIIVVVLVINIGLFYALRSKNTLQQIDLLRKAGRAASNPWKKEEDSIDELAEKVSRLKKKEKTTALSIPEENESKT
ncbi:MAG: hypothetical protein AB9891_14620 [Anaerolineaceae bacterium]